MRTERQGEDLLVKVPFSLVDDQVCFVVYPCICNCRKLAFKVCVLQVDELEQLLTTAEVRQGRRILRFCGYIAC